jgi:chitodextrinase
VTAVRVGSHDGYDRLVMEFSGAVPSYTVSIQSGTQFTQAPKGDTVTFEGSNGVLVTVKQIDWTAYAGPTAFDPRYLVLQQARLVQNFEGTQQWAMGIAGTPAVRVFTLSSPARLVIDVTAR